METLAKPTKEVLAAWDGAEEDDAEFLWDDFIYEVQTIMKKMKTKKFFAYGLNLTWRNVAGYTEFETDSARTLVNKLTPNSDFTMKFYPTENKGIIEVVIAHHDKPMGETLYLMAQSREKKEGIKKEHFNN